MSLASAPSGTLFAAFCDHRFFAQLAHLLDVVAQLAEKRDQCNVIFLCEALDGESICVLWREKREAGDQGGDVAKDWIGF